MATDKKRLSVSFVEEDYQWLDEKAELTGNSKAAVVRQIVRGLRLRRPGLLTFEADELVFTKESNAPAKNNHNQKQDREKQIDDSEKSGIEAFRTT